MKVLFDQQIFFWQRYGGISRIYARIAEEMKVLGHDPKIFAGINLNKYLPELPDGLVVGKTLENYPPKTLGVFKRFNLLWGNTYEKFQRPDILHETYFSQSPVINSKAKVVVGLYDMIQELYPHLFQKDYLITPIKKKALERADHIISISHQSKMDCCEIFGIEESKISVVHLAADSPFSDLSGVKFENPRPYLLYVGDRNGYKNFNGFLEAFSFSQVLKHDFDIIAFGGGKFSAQDLSKFQSLGFREDQVKQLSGDDRLLGKLYSEAQALIYPSLYEGFGIPPLEAMGYGCPVIACNQSSIPEIVGDAGLLIDTSDTEELKASMEKVIMDISFKEDLKKKGFVKSQMFSWKKTAEETLDVYQKLN